MKKSSFIKGKRTTGCVLMLGLMLFFGTFTVQAEEEKTDSPVTGYQSYDPIIQKYIKALQEGWDMQKCSDNGICYLTGYGYTLADMGYCLMDVDGNGIEDLLIGEKDSEDYTGMFFDLYTIVDEQATLVGSSEERDRYYLCGDNVILNEGSGGASNSSWGKYQMKGSQLELMEYISFDSDKDSNEPWFYGTPGSDETHITEEEAEDLLTEYQKMEIPYISFASVLNEETTDTEEKTQKDSVNTENTEISETETDAETDTEAKITPEAEQESAAETDMETKSDTESGTEEEDETDSDSELSDDIRIKCIVGLAEKMLNQ